MKTVCEFKKVPFEEFNEACLKVDYFNHYYLMDIYKNIKIPQRSTTRSSGYDFFAPYKIELNPGQSKVIPTGINCEFFEDGYDLSIYPRSGLGFKYGIALSNTVGIIDNDYYDADNHGHIMIKLTAPSSLKDTVTIEQGKAFAQGIIREFFLAKGDEDIEKQQRTGGFGSTDSNN